MSIAKGIVKTAENVVKMNADTMQIFSRNPRGSNYKDPTVKEAEEFQRIRREAGFGAILAHAPYTMNACAANGLSAMDHSALCRAVEIMSAHEIAKA